MGASDQLLQCGAIMRRYGARAVGDAMGTFDDL